MHMRRMFLLALALVLAIAAGAEASTVRVEGDKVIFEAAPGETNRLTTVNLNAEDPNRYSLSSITFQDPGTSGVTPGPGCVRSPTSQDGIERTTCNNVDNKTLVIRLGDGNDTLQTLWYLGAGSLIEGGSGDDNLGGGSGKDTIDGGEGNDLMSGDEFYEDADINSWYDVHRGDEFIGGPGVDTVSYFYHRPGGARTVTIDDQANDGDPGEGDNVRNDVEGVEGPLYGTVSITGNGGDNFLYGTSGADTLDGGGGNDVIRGFQGLDKLLGGTGSDSLEGGAGDDTLDGGPDTDSFVGDSSSELVAGNDTILARDGLSEKINCGPGADSVVGDNAEQLATDRDSACETLDGPVIAPAPTPTPAPAPTADATPFVSLPSGTQRVRRGGVQIAIGCRLATSCRGLLQLRSRNKLGKGRRKRYVELPPVRFLVAAGRTGVVRVSVPSAHARRMGRTASFIVEAATLTGGAPASSSVKLLR